MSKVSVIIPCYNLGNYLEEAVASVLAQTMRDFEIIIVNDGSTDDFTNEALANYRRHKTTVLTISNRGLPGARNYGIARAKGDFIVCLDADDFLEPACLEKAAGVLREKGDVGVVSFWYRAFGEEEWTSEPEGCTLLDELIQNRLCVSAMFRRSAWEKIGGYDEAFVKGYEDWEFWIRMLGAGHRAEILHEYLFRYRVRQDSMIKSSDKPENRDAILTMMIEKHSDLFRENAIPVLLRKEQIISGILDYMKKMREAQKWHIDRNREHERIINDFLEAKEWFLKQLENHKAVVAQQQAEIARQRGEIECRQADIARLGAEVAQKQSTIDAREHELRSVYLSKIWKLGCAVRDARHSIRAALLLPFRIVNLCIIGPIKDRMRKAS